MGNHAQSLYYFHGFQRVRLKHNLNTVRIKGLNSHVHREFPGNVESTNRGRDNLSREIGRTSRALPGFCCAHQGFGAARIGA